jgi:hypothetical protein
MRRIVGIVTLGASVLVACSGGGGAAAPTTTTASASATTTTTVAATTTTVAPEQAVKAAYLAYWAMLDRLNAAPDASDPEISQRAASQLAKDIVDGLTTRAAEGTRLVFPADKPNTHDVSAVGVSNATATLMDCYVDFRVKFDASGSVIDDAVVTKLGRATLEFDGTVWKVRELEFIQRTPGVTTCSG